MYQAFQVVYYKGGVFLFFIEIQFIGFGDELKLDRHMK